MEKNLEGYGVLPKFEKSEIDRVVRCKYRPSSRCWEWEVGKAFCFSTIFPEKLEKVSVLPEKSLVKVSSHLSPLPLIRMTFLDIGSDPMICPLNINGINN